MPRVDLQNQRLDDSRLGPMTPVSKRRPPGLIEKMLRAIFFKIFKIVFVIVLLAAGPVYLLTASGLIPLPLIGDLIYQPPTPDHDVTAGTPLSTSSIETLRLSESALTASVRQGLSAAEKTFDLSAAQVAVIDGKGVEVFLPFKGNAQHTALTMLMNLKISDGKIQPSVIGFYFGQLPVSPRIIDTLLGASLASALDAFNAELIKVVSVDSVEYAAGKVLIHGKLIAP